MDFDLTLLSKILTPMEEKKIKVYLGYIMYDVFTEKVSYPIFKERMEPLNIKNKFNLFKIFKEICGKEKKYITLPRLIKAYYKYKTNSKDATTHLKNFFSFVLNDLVGDYSNKNIGCVTKKMKEFSTKKESNRSCLTEIQVLNNYKNEIVGLSLTYDNNFNNTFLAPNIDQDAYIEPKIDCHLTVNTNLIDANDNPEDADYARDYITHVFGTHTSVIESLGFRTAFGKHYYTGRPNKGKMFLMGTTKKRLHTIKIGMDTRLNCLLFKCKTGMCNSNINISFKDLKKEDFEIVYPDEKALRVKENKEFMDKLIKTPYLLEKDIEESEEDNDASGDSFDEICNSSDSAFDLDESNNSEEEDKAFHTLMNLVEDEDVKNELHRFHFVDHKKATSTKKFKEDIIKSRNPSIIENETLPIASIDNIEYMENINKNKVDTLKNALATKIDIAELLVKTENLDVFINRYIKAIKGEIDEQNNLKNKVNSMKNDFYIKYINRNKDIKDWEQFEDKIDYSQDYNIYYNEILEIIKNNADEIKRKEMEKFENENEKLFSSQKTNFDRISNDVNSSNPTQAWKTMSSFLLTQKNLALITGGLLSICKNAMFQMESMSEAKLSMKEKLSILKLLLKYKNNGYLEKLKSDFKVKIEKYKKEKNKDIKNKIIKRGASSVKLFNLQSQKTKSYNITEKDVASFYNTSVTNLKNNLNDYIQLNRKQYRNYCLIINKRKIPNDLIKFWDKYNTLRDIKHWFNKEEMKLHREIMQKSTDVDLEKLKIKELEKRKQIVEANKQAILDEKKQHEDRIKNLIKNPVATSEIINKFIEENENYDDLSSINTNSQTYISGKKKSSKKINNLSDNQDNNKVTVANNNSIYRKQKIPTKNLKFVDDIFTADTNSLCPKNSNNKFILPPDAYIEDVEGWDSFEWSEFKEIFKGNDYQVFLDKIEENDIIQGGLGDCYFLSAIAALTKYPQLIRKLFLFQERSNEGCYGIRLRVNGIWKIILLDEKIPATSGRFPDFVFSRTNDKELWVVLLEKGWAKLCGSYIRAVGGLPDEVFDCISNSASESIDISPKNIELIWNKLIESKENNFIMTAGSGFKESINYQEVGIISGHAYTVLSCHKFFNNGVNTRLIKLRNPWGNSEFSGDWSDNSSQWNDKLKHKLGVNDKDDGVFFMHIDDFIKYFSIFSICKIYPDYHHTNIKINQENTRSPKAFELKVSKDSKVFIQLHQKNLRFLLRDGTYPTNSYCFIMILDLDYNYIASSSSCKNVETIELDLPRGNYLIVSDVSYRYINSNNLHSYALTCISENIAEFFTTTESPYDLIKKGILSYSLENLTLSQYPNIETGNINYAFYNKDNSLFPFIFMFAQNMSKSDAIMLLKTKGLRGMDFLNQDIDENLYDNRELNKNTHNEEEKEIQTFNNLDNNKRKNVSIIRPNEYDCIILRKYRTDAKSQFSPIIYQIYSDDQLISLCLSKGNTKYLKDQILINEYSHQMGFGLLFINNSKNNVKIKLLFNLINLEINYESSNSNEIYVHLKAKDKKLVSLKAIDPEQGFSYAKKFYLE